MVNNAEKIITTIKTNEILDDPNVFVKIKNRSILNNIKNKDVEDITYSLSNDLNLILSSEFPELPTHTLSFKKDIKSMVARMLDNIYKKNKRIVFFDLSIYSSLFIEKNNSAEEKFAVDKIIENFKNKTEKNENKILKIEYIDVLFVFFPNKDIKNSLKFDFL